jgi:hypothetical protein
LYAAWNSQETDPDNSGFFFYGDYKCSFKVFNPESGNPDNIDPLGDWYQSSVTVFNPDLDNPDIV